MNRRSFAKKTIALVAGVFGISAVAKAKSGYIGPSILGGGGTGTGQIEIEQRKFSVGDLVIDGEGRVAEITDIMPRYPKQWDEGCGIYSTIWDRKYPDWRTQTMAVLTYKKRVFNLKVAEQREYNCWLAKQKTPFPDGIVVRRGTKTLIRPLSSLRKIVLA